jgi:hypothetical protein
VSRFARLGCEGNHVLAVDEDREDRSAYTAFCRFPKVDRDGLARLLTGEGEAFAACRRAVVAGARFWISKAEQLTPVSALVPIYARRDAHTRRVGIPTLGFAAAVEALRGRSEQLVRIGAVDSDDPPYHYQLFLNEDLTAVVAVLGVDQNLGYRLRPGEQVLLTCEIVSWVRDDFPGWIRVRVTDAAGRAWFLIDKAPIFQVEVTAESMFPVPAAVRCAVVEIVRGEGEEGPPRLVVSTAVDGIAAEDGTDRFTVAGDMLRRIPLT